MIKIEGPADFRKKIKFADGKEDALMRYLDDSYQRILADRQPLMEDCENWAQQANSRRKRKDVGPLDANLDMPLTRKRMTQNSSRLKNPILQQETFFTTRQRNAREDSKALALEVERVLDYMMDRLNSRELLDDWIEQFQVFPTGVIKTPFIYEKEKVFRWEEIDFETYDTIKDDSEYTVLVRDLDDGSQKFYVEREEWIDRKVGCFPEVVPFEDFLVPNGTKDIESAEVIFHRIWCGRQAIKDRVREGVYDEKYQDNKVIDRIGMPAEERERLMIPINSPLKKGMMTEKNHLHYCLLECYLRFDVNDDDEEEEIIVTYEPNTKTILRADHNGFQSYRRPFISHEYKRVVGSIYGDPLTFMLEPLHVANSASVNQRLDAASLANSITLFVPPNSDIQRVLSRRDIRAAVYEVDFDPNDIYQFGIDQRFTQLPELESQFEQSADELASLSPYSFGQEQSDRPTASGMITIIEESKQPQYDMLERFREKLSLMAKHMLSRYKQFFPEGLVYYMMGTDEQQNQLIKQVMQWPDGLIENDVIIETTASSSQMSKALRKQEVVGIMEKLPMWQQTVMGLAQVAADVNNPAAPAAMSMIRSFQAGLDFMLREFEVPNKDAINAPIEKDIEYGKQVQALVQENMQLKQVLQRLQGGGPGGPPGNQAPGLSGPPQPPGGIPRSM